MHVRTRFRESLTGEYTVQTLLHVIAIDFVQLLLDLSSPRALRHKAMLANNLLYAVARKTWDQQIIVTEFKLIVRLIIWRTFMFVSQDFLLALPMMY